MLVELASVNAPPAMRADLPESALGFLRIATLILASDIAVLAWAGHRQPFLFCASGGR